MLRLCLLVVLFTSCLAYIPDRSEFLILPSPQPSAGRIVGGVETTIQTVPYQIALLFSGSLLCGGSIIKPNTVISAGHCVITSTSSYFSIRAGSNYHSSGGLVVAVRNITRHNNFNDYNIDYDVSMFILSSSLVLGSNVATIKLPGYNQSIPIGARSIVSGWGATSEGGSIASVIRMVNIPIVDQKVCVAAYSQVGWQVTDRMVCAGNLTAGGQDACQGDSGGPLVINGELIGITSWGYGCARRGYPGVWARVPALVDWINKNL